MGDWLMNVFIIFDGWGAILHSWLIHMSNVNFLWKPHQRFVVTSRWCFVLARTTKIRWCLWTAFPYRCLHEKLKVSLNYYLFRASFGHLYIFLFFLLFSKDYKIKKECILSKHLKRSPQPKVLVEKVFKLSVLNFLAV